jgi:hypothetical protein
VSEIGTGDKGDMTKIGEGPGGKPGVNNYKAELDVSSTKFLKALENYNKSESGEEQEHLKTVMDQQMGLIQSSLRELQKQGLHKQAGLVAKDYKEYREEQSEENYICLHNDVETLRELNS